METYWAAPAAARDHVAALDRPSTVCVPVKSARAARGGAQQQGDHEASITPIARCQPDFGRQSMVGWTDCPSGKGSLPRSSLLCAVIAVRTSDSAWHGVGLRRPRAGLP